MLKFLKWLIEGRPHVTYEGYHCGCCGSWEDEEFSIPTYKSYGKWADTWGLCSKCREPEKEEIKNEKSKRKL